MATTESPSINHEFIKDIKGKKFVEYSGLLDFAHNLGLTSLEVEVLQYPNDSNNNTAICKATATSESGRTFSDIGDANIKNTTSMISPHLIRMASTRAKGRTLRDFCNIGYCCLEELNDTNGNNGAQSKAQNKPQNKPQNTTASNHNSFEFANKLLEQLCSDKLFGPINDAFKSAQLQPYASVADLVEAIKETYFAKAGLNTKTVETLINKVNADPALLTSQLIDLLAACSAPAA